MSPPDLPTTLSEIRQLTDRYKTGNDDSFYAFGELLTKILHLTILPHSDFVRLHRVAGGGALALGGVKNPTDPLRLNDGNYLRLAISLYIDVTDKGPRMKVSNSKIQYQEDFEGERPVFRYDYLRLPRGHHPGSHLHMYGDLAHSDCLPSGKPLGRVHFPTRRISLEAIVRLLAVDFEIACNTEHAFWRPVLAESERLFREIAHEST